MLYGGEISLLGFSFLESIYRIIASIAPIYIITNLSDLDFCKKVNCLSGVRIGTSLNKERDHYPETLQSLMQLDIPIDITSVVTPSLLIENTKTLLKECQYIGRNIGFIQYSKSQANLFRYNILNKEYEDFIKRIIYAYESGSYTFYLNNIDSIKSALRKEYTPSMESLIFITPENLFASIQYDDENCEYFKTYSSLLDWQRDCKREEVMYAVHCKDCKYYKHCLAEHIRSWDSEDECCGMKGLLKFYENIHQNNGIL